MEKIFKIEWFNERELTASNVQRILSQWLSSDWCFKVTELPLESKWCECEGYQLPTHTAKNEILCKHCYKPFKPQPSLPRDFDPIADSLNPRACEKLNQLRDYLRSRE